METPCELGTHAYWEAAYSSEQQNFKEFGDEGEVWFGETVLETLLDWLVALLHRHFEHPSTTRILDIGCGNGHVVMDLFQRGFQNLIGTDYSLNSISLCHSIAEAKQITTLRFQVDDILDSKLTEKFDVAFDKGTFDAISLSEDGAHKRALYVEAVWKLLSDQGLLILTSCNFTISELKSDFTSHFEFLNQVDEYPCFEYGGQKGTTVSTVAFQIKQSTSHDRPS